MSTGSVIMQKQILFLRVSAVLLSVSPTFASLNETEPDIPQELHTYSQPRSVSLPIEIKQEEPSGNETKEQSPPIGAPEALPVVKKRFYITSPVGRRSSNSEPLGLKKKVPQKTSLKESSVLLQDENVSSRDRVLSSSQQSSKISAVQEKKYSFPWHLLEDKERDGAISPRRQRNSSSEDLQNSNEDSQSSSKGSRRFKLSNKDQQFLENLLDDFKKSTLSSLPQEHRNVFKLDLTSIQDQEEGTQRDIEPMRERKESPDASALAPVL